MTSQTPSTSTSLVTAAISEPDTRSKPFGSIVQAHVKVLIKLSRQRERATHHTEVLTEAIGNNRPPKGLVPRINPRIPEASANFTLDWEKELHNTGLKLTQKLLEFWKSKQEHIVEETSNIFDSLRTIATPEQCKEIEEILEEITRTTVMDLKRKKTPARSTSQSTLLPARKQSLTQVQFLRGKENSGNQSRQSST